MSLLLITAIILVLITSSFANNANCNNANECANTVINADTANCLGYNGCYQSTINAKFAYCSGPYACKASPAINIELSIGCNGYESCRDAGSITSDKSSIWCYGELSCSYTGITTEEYSSNRVACYGRKACYQSDIDTISANCFGRESCQYADIRHSKHYNPGTQTIFAGTKKERDVTIKKTFTYCDGFYSCHRATIDARKQYCYGRASCFIHDSQSMTLYAYGANSAERSTINSRTVHAFGFRSLVQSKISSHKRPSVTVNAYGFMAGKGAIFLCRKNSNCKLNCLNNGCIGMVFLCQMGSVCDVTPSGCNAYENVIHPDKPGKVNGIDCPRYLTSTSAEEDDELLDIFENDEYGQDDDYDDYDLYNDLMIDYEEDKLLEKEMKISSEIWAECDDERECVGRVITNADSGAQCSGPYSCENADITYRRQIECLGLWACHNAIRLVSDTGIICNSARSCYDADLISAQRFVKCAGPWSCDKVPLIESKSGNVFCSGLYGCSESTVTAARIANCDGYKGCISADITSPTVRCSAPDSCWRATLRTTTQVTCDGLRACKEATITTKQLFVYGPYALASASITAEEIHGLGYYSLAHADIDSGNLNMMKIYSYGYNAGIDADVTCNSGSNCQLYCKYDGCKDMNFMCLAGSTCSIEEPVGCLSDNSVHNVDGVVCPHWTVSSSKEEDEEILSDKKERRDDFEDYNDLINDIGGYDKSGYTENEWIMLDKNENVNHNKQEISVFAREDAVIGSGDSTFDMVYLGILGAVAFCGLLLCLVLCSRSYNISLIGKDW